MKSTPGPGRFNFYLNALEDILTKASQASSPAEALTKTNARTLCFMGEGLCRIYASLHDKKVFDRLREYFKSIEDLLGEIDYYECFAADFLKDPCMPATVRLQTEFSRAEKIAELDALLLKEKWIKNSNPRTARLKKELKSLNWPAEKKEIDGLRDVYNKAIKKIGKFYTSTGGVLTKPEEELHELRRKLRWLSIYPHAMQGAIQLQETAEKRPGIEKYLVPAVINSAYNKMPAQEERSETLLLDKDSFLALSWLIAETGKLKDECLRVEATAEAVAATQFVGGRDAMNRADELNACSNVNAATAMKKANMICADFIREGHLQRLVSTTKKFAGDAT